QYILDKRNFLIFDIFEIIDRSNFKYILIENVPKYLKMYFPYEDKLCTLKEILEDKYSEKYTIKIDVLNVENYGVPQSRPRAIIRMFEKNLTWLLPNPQEKISLKEAIGYLPSLESEENSGIRYHVAKKVNKRYIEALKHTSEGKSAIGNKKHYPKSVKGEKIKGFHNTFKRMKWDKPASARTTYCGNVNSHNNVHPGRKMTDGNQSDARPLTLLETYIVSSIPKDTTFPTWASETYIYTIIGEGIPPLFLRKILLSLSKK
ncbi:MAG: DNA cytosine methyltransferase, partial [Parcubacteria group bacterium]|nr:DNA cytosine methyltransferase [Parcubacteria group bacterium]